MHLHPSGQVRCSLGLAAALLILAGGGCGLRRTTVAPPPVSATPASAPFEMVPPRSPASPRPPMAIPVRLPRPGLVTLVIEDAAGVRVRNLISETPLPAGDSIVWWDGLDDRRRDTNAAAHAVYHVPGSPVAPGTYTVRGLVHDPLDLVYEFAVYNPGNPPWRTASRTSEWLTNHTPPSAVCFVPGGVVPVREGQTEAPPQVLIGSFVAEGGSGLAWVDLDGRKLHGQMWLGGVWTGARFLARDPGPQPVPGVYAYAASSWKGDKYNDNQAELRLHKLVNDAQRRAAPRDTRFGTGEDPPVLEPTWKFPAAAQEGIGGLAAWNGLLLVSLPRLDSVLVVDVAAGTALGLAPLPQPRGLVTDAAGHLFAVSGTRVLRFTLPPRPGGGADTLDLGPAQPVVGDGLGDPQQLALDAAGSLYVGDAATNQVKVFTPDGRLVRTVGDAGQPAAGPYAPTLMHNPQGLAIDERGRLWVAEDDHQPKRVSVWTPDGRLERAFYGPPEYGGGGVLDPQDPRRFYLRGMTFALDWKRGLADLRAIRWRPGPDDFRLPAGPHAGGPPDTPLYVGRRRYYTNCFTSSPTGGTAVTSIWRETGDIAVPVAAFGNAQHWEWLRDPVFAERIPAEARNPRKPEQPPDFGKVLFVWSDLNGDGAGQPGEVVLRAGTVGSGVTVGHDLSLVTAQAVRYAPVGFTGAGVPLYDLDRGEVLCPGTQRPTSSGGGQVLLARDGRTVLTTAPAPFAPQSVGGAAGGVARWSYPSPWPGLHASHIAPPPEFPGDLIGTTRLLGPSFTLDTPARDELWAINGNKGTVYLFTTDGLFVSTLFQDTRTPHSAWSERPRAERGMSVSDLTNNEESFWPSITRTRDGRVFVVTNYPALLRVDGLDSLRRLPDRQIEVTAAHLQAARASQLEAERQRQAATAAPAPLRVALLTTPPTVDGRLDEWPVARFVTIDVRQKQVGDWGRRKQETQAALAVCGDRLYAAFRTGEPRALDNAGGSLPNLFKTGGALDLMLGTDPAAPARQAAAAGDLRLLVAQVKGQPVAVLYRPVVPGHAGDGVPFGSPLRTIRFDEVRDVSAELVFAQGTETTEPGKGKPPVTGPGGDFEFSVPLATLGLGPAPGLSLRGDVGVLRGSGLETTQRAYWHNKATGLVSDIPSEAELTPHLWGTLEFAAPAP